MSNCIEALRTVLCHEVGGDSNGGLNDRLNDPGGITKWGVTGPALAAFLGHLITHGDIAMLTQGEACALYEKNYWAPMNCDKFGQLVATKVLDVAVNCGVRRATILAQRAACVADDGVMGPKTVAAIVAMPVPLFIENLRQALVDFYESIVASRPASNGFLEGWLVRANCTVQTPCRTCLAFLKRF